jgi:glutamate racemase
MIGIFDSGVGGMTVARAVETLLPDYQFIYYGDLARTPYGSKSSEAIIEYSIENTEFLIEHGAKVIIIACNSAASVASDILRQKFTQPVFEVISPAVERAVSSTVHGNIGVIGTRATIRSGIYDLKIKQLGPKLRVFSQACPLLVPLVEEGWLDARETKMILAALTLKKYLNDNPVFCKSMQRGSKNKYFVSDITKAAVATAEKIFGRPIDLEKV